MRCLNEFTQLFKRNAPQHGLDVKDLRLWKVIARILPPTVTGVSLDIGHDADLDRVLVDVAEQGVEVIYVVYELGTERSLKRCPLGHCAGTCGCSNRRRHSRCSIVRWAIRYEKSNHAQQR